MAMKAAAHGSQFSGTRSHGDLDSLEVIEDRTGCRRKNGLPARYHKGKFLGKGGFAKCYEVQDMETKEIFAAKIVAKSSITKPRAHAKLRSEISIHRSLDHEKVVHFYDYFEDSEYVYIILELCHNQTLNEFMRKRPNKRLSEQETMFYAYELISALKYLHRRRVIHRDLKLGNLFLDSNNCMKVGDFGLAAQLEHDGEKKRTICGTPNYIAPEILEGKHGHSYEVDIWSLGVILYTMLVGRPPFETADVKTTYRRIRYNQYTFPDTVRLSDPAKDLISSILRTDPRSRPGLDEILASPWFQTSRLPPPMPGSISAYAASPRPNSACASARSETPERGGADFARIDSPAPRFPLRDRSPGAAVQTPTAHVPQVPQALPRGQSAGPATKSSPLMPNCGGTTPGRYPAGPNGSTGRPPLAAHRGNEENAPPATASEWEKAVCAPLSNGNAQSPIPAPSQPPFLGTAAAQSPRRTPSTSTVGNASARALQPSTSYTPQPTGQFGMGRTASHSHQPPSTREASPVVGNPPTKVVAHGYSSARSTSSPRQPLQSSARYGGSSVANASTPKDNRTARVLGQPSMGATDSGPGPLFTKTTPAIVRGTAAQPVPSRRPNTASCDSPRPASLAGSQASFVPSTSIGNPEPDSARLPSSTPPQTAQDRRFPQSLVQSARKKERSSSSPALLLDGEPTTPAAPLPMGRCGSDSYRKAPESGIRGLPSSRSNQGLNSPAEVNFAACLGGALEHSSSRPPVQVNPNAMPELWVVKWVDYSSKYGVGYTLSDGSIGVYFNDSTKIMLSAEGDYFDYITRRTQEKPEVRTKHTYEDYPEDLKKKVTLLRHFRNYMLTDVLEKKDGASVGESSLPAPVPKQKGSTATSEVCESGQAPYVKKWTRNKHAIMFQLSNKIVQVVFFDKTEAVLSSRSHMVTYVDKQSKVVSYPLSNVLDVPSPELAKRLRYTKDILVNLLGARTSDLGGA